MRTIRGAGLATMLVLGALALAGAAAGAVAAEDGAAAKARAPLYLISGPVEVPAGGRIRAAFVNLGRTKVHLSVAFVGADGVYEREQEAEVAAGRTGFVEYAPGSDFLGVVQLTVDPKPAKGAYRAALIGAIGAGGAGTYLLYRYSADDIAGSPLPR
jgi:hypothetical protein